MTIDEKIQKAERTLQTESELQPLRVSRLKKRRTEPLRDFIHRFISDWNKRMETIVVSTRVQQCDPGRRRSLDDIYKIALYYYPGTPLLEVVGILHDLMQENHFRTSACGFIQKRVFYHDERQPNGIYNIDWSDQHELNYNQWIRKAKQWRETQ